MIVHVEERGLRILLRAVGAIMASALLAVFMPSDWMAWCHRRLGLGEFPTAPIVNYLARSLSLFYAIFGGLLIVISFDPRRYRALLLYVAATGVAGGALVWGIDLHAGLPPRWIAFEGPPAIAISALLLWRVLRIPRK